MTPAIKKTLADRRAAALQRAAAAEEAAKQIPDYLTAERRIRALAYELAVDPTPAKELEYAELVVRRDALLAQYGLDPTPRFTCPVCRDTGYLDGRVCDCVKEAEREEVRAKLRSAPETVTFDDSRFDLFGDDAPRMQKLYGKLRTFAEKLDETKICGVLLTGSVGSGKTRLANCVYTEALTRGHSALWSTAFALGNLCLDVHTSFDRKDALDTVLDAELLVIDDLGTEPIYRNVTLQYFYSILNERMQKRKKTLLTTNLTLDQILDRYGERIFSRLNDKSIGAVFSMTGKDLRLRT